MIMGSCMPFPDEKPFAERVKNLAEDELLEIWEETQQIECMISAELHTEITIAPDYERLIVEELRLRSSRRAKGGHASALRSRWAVIRRTLVFALLLFCAVFPGDAARKNAVKNARPRRLCAQPGTGGCNKAISL